MTWRPDPDDAGWTPERDLEEDEDTLEEEEDDEMPEEAQVGTGIEMIDENGERFVGVVIDPPEPVWLYRIFDKTRGQEFTVIWRDERFYLVHEPEEP